MSNAIEIQNLVKRYNSIEALRGVSFGVKEGELFGLIGPDGSGKTSLFRILVSLLKPDEGSISAMGFDPVKDYKEIRKIIGYMPERFSLYQDLTVEENLNFFASIFNTKVEDNYYLIEDIFHMLVPFKKRRAGKLSGGMKQKLALSCALIHKPELLILDEPTTGVDAVSRKEFWEILKRLKDQGITIMVSTPYMDEAILCDRVALIQNGEILSVDTPASIAAKFPHRLIAVKANDMFRLPGDLKCLDGIISAHRFGETIHVSLPSGSEDEDEGILQALMEKGHDNLEWNAVLPGIEDCFMDLMVKEA